MSDQNEARNVGWVVVGHDGGCIWELSWPYTIHGTAAAAREDADTCDFARHPNISRGGNVGIARVELIEQAKGQTLLADGTVPIEPAPTGLEPGEIVAVPADLRVDPNGVQWEWWDQCFQNWHPCSIKWPLAERRTICRPIQNGDPR